MKRKYTNKVRSGVSDCVLPFFPGFYGGWFDLTYLIETESELMYDEYISVIGEENAERVQLSTDDFEPTESAINAYKKGIAERFLHILNEYVPDWVDGFEFTGIESPRSYNFSNDKVICDIFLKKGWEKDVESFIEENIEDLREDIRNDWSSRSGFLSFIDNDVYNWYDKIMEEPSLYLPLLITYAICYNEANSIENITNEIAERVLSDEYIELECINNAAQKMYDKFSR